MTASSTPALDQNHRPSKILFHALGGDAADDRLVYEEKDPGFFMNVGGSRTDDWIMISINDHETIGIRLLTRCRSDRRAEAGGGARDRPAI